MIQGVVHGVAHGHTGRIDTAVVVYRLLQILLYLAVLVAYAVVGVQLGILVEGAVGRSAVGGGVVDISNVADEQAFVAVADVDADALAINARAPHHARRLVEPGISLIAQFVRTALQVDAVAMGKHRFQRLRQPVGVHSALHLEQLAAVDVVAVFHVHNGSDLVVVARAPFQLQLLGGVQQVVVRQVGILHLVVAVVGHAQAAGFGSLRLDHHHAVRGLRAVDGHGGSIFQQRHAFDLCRVEVHNLGYAHVDDAIEHKQRLVRARVDVTTHDDCLVSRIVAHARLSAHREVRHGAGVRAGEHVVTRAETGVEHRDGI